MHHKFSPQNKMETLPKESHLVLALEALKKDSKLSIWKAATIYEIPKTSLHNQCTGKQSQSELPANSQKLTDLEEKVILERVLDLDVQGFQTQLSNIWEMADHLQANCNVSHIEPQWVNGFVKWHSELTMHFQCQIDYQRTQCEDLNVINVWFQLVQNMVDKYAIQEEDIYNFNKTSFLMSILSRAKVVTSSECCGWPHTKQSDNWKWVTVIQTMCADGSIVPPYFVVKGKNHLLPWYQNSQFQLK